MVGIAVNVTEVPAHTGFPDAEMVKLTGNTGDTDTGYWMLDAGLPVVQVSEDVSVQLTRSPLLGINE